MPEGVGRELGDDEENVLGGVVRAAHGVDGEQPCGHAAGFAGGLRARWQGVVHR